MLRKMYKRNKKEKRVHTHVCIYIEMHPRALYTLLEGGEGTHV